MSEAASRERDRDCLRRLAEGDVGVLETIWEVHGDRAFRHALWVTRRREDAEDVVQSVFVRLAAMGAELLGVRELGPYLGTMVHHAAVAMSKRRAASETERHVDPDLLLAPDEDVEGEADRSRIAAIVAQLPLEQREVIVLHVWGGLTFRAIGRVTGVSTFTAASRYRLATSRMRRVLEGGHR